MSRRNLISKYIAVFVLLVPGPTLTRAQMGPPVGPDKRLIAWACDRVDTQQFNRRAAEFEQSPFDGLVITVNPDDLRGRDGRYARWFGGKIHRLDDFKLAVAELRAVKPSRLTDNFIDLMTTVRRMDVAKGGQSVMVDPTDEEMNLDWFDPRWSVIAENCRIAAKIAKLGGFKGLFIDHEHYAGGRGLWRKPFGYEAFKAGAEAAGQSPRSIGAYRAQVTKRGREMMQAMTSVYPDITIVMIHDTGWAGGPLVDALVRGMLEVRGEATIVDGIEQAYRAMTYRQLKSLRATAERREDEIYDDIEYGFGIWWDFRIGQKMQSFDGRRAQDNARSPARLEYPLYNALTAADRYVWVYSFGAYLDSVWWNSNYGDGADWAIAIPQAYLDAFANCRRPHDLSWTPPTLNPRVWFDDAALVVETDAGESENLFRNGGFERWAGNDGEPPDGWAFITSGHQSAESGRVWRDDRKVKAGRLAPRLGMAASGDTGHTSLDQDVNAVVLAGSKVRFSAWIASEAEEVGNLEIVGIYHGTQTTISGPDEHGWRLHTMTATMPKDLRGSVTFRLRAFIPFIPVEH